MAGKSKKQSADTANIADASSHAASKNKMSSNIFALTNRGMLLDIFVFLLNIFLMHRLTQVFLEIARQAANGDTFAGYAIFIFFIAIFILPPFGSVLKRWHFHHRRQIAGKNSNVSEDVFGGCLFNPLFFFILNLLIYIGILAMAENKIYGDDEQGHQPLLGALSVFGIVLVGFQTFVVYRYFSPPKHPPTTTFFRSPFSELLGDASIYLNMILSQIIWNVITSASYSTRRVSGIEDLIGRFFMWILVALIVYFPPRVFYLAEDITRRRVWLTILLANAPVIYRILIGVNPAN